MPYCENENGEIEVYQLSDESKRKIKGYLDNYFNPHIWGNTAKELFFVEDGVIVVEGQDDVMLYQRAAEQLGIALKGDFSVGVQAAHKTFPTFWGFSRTWAIKGSSDL